MQKPLLYYVGIIRGKKHEIETDNYEVDFSDFSPSPDEAYPDIDANEYISVGDEVMKWGDLPYSTKDIIICKLAESFEFCEYVNFMDTATVYERYESQRVDWKRGL